MKGKNEKRKTIEELEKGEEAGRAEFKERTSVSIGHFFDVKVPNDQNLRAFKGLKCEALVYLGPRPTTYGKIETFALAKHPSGMRISEFSEEARKCIGGLQHVPDDRFILVSQKNCATFFA